MTSVLTGSFRKAGGNQCQASFVGLLSAANLLHNASTTQSSVYQTYSSDLAVDGDTGRGYLLSGHCSRTKETNFPVWKAHMGRVATIGTVRLFNRVDYQQVQLDDVEVWVGSNGAKYNAVGNKQCSPATTFTWSHASPGYPFSICCGLTGSFVFVRLPHYGVYLSLCEVVAYAPGSNCGVSTCLLPPPSPPPPPSPTFP